MPATPGLPRISPISAGIAIVVFGSMAIGTLVAFSLVALVPFVRTGSPPGDWTFTQMAVTLLIIVALYAHLGFTVYQAFRVGFSEGGLSLPTLRGWRFVSWSDVRGVGVRGPRVVLDAPGGKVVINLICFSDARAVVSYLADRLASHAAQGADAGSPAASGLPRPPPV